jgi:hypothetical protein
MGLFDYLMGNLSEVANPEALEKRLAPLLVEGEVLEHAYQLWRDQLLFTNKRLIVVDKQGVTGTKVEWRSIPYRSIEQFSAETAGLLDMDSELVLYVRGTAPLRLEFRRGSNLNGVMQTLAKYVL